MKLDYSIKKLEKKAYEIRKKTLEMCIKAKTGHVTSSFSCVDILVGLYYGGILKHNPKNPELNDRDRFILSKGQASPVFYNVLADRGYFPKKWLDSFCEPNGHFGVHLQCDIPGAEITAGSLGHGLGIGCGIASAAKMNRRDYLTIVMLGDAELYEGSNWEYAMYAGHNRLNNLIGIVDRNWLGVTDFTERGLQLNPINKKFEAFGWNTKTIDGHNFEQIKKAFEGVREFKQDSPLMIIAETIKGKGIPFMENVPLWHGLAPTKKEDIERARKELAESYSYLFQGDAKNGY